MLVVFLPIFMADTKIISGYNFVASLSILKTYLNYVNLSWGSTNRTNVKTLVSQQKHSVRVINNRTRFNHTNKFFTSQKILKIYKLNMSSVAVFMYQFRNKTASLTFSGRFEKLYHGFSTKISTI